MSLTDNQRRFLRYFWIAAMCLVIIGELAPATSHLMRTVYALHINDKVLHFSAYLLLSVLPAISFSNRRRGIAAAVLMALLGILLEGGQHFSPGRDVSLGDVLANNIGVICGLIIGLPLRA